MFEQIHLKNKINFAKKGPFNKINNNNVIKTPHYLMYL